MRRYLDYEKLLRYRFYQRRSINQFRMISMAKFIVGWVLLKSKLFYTRPRESKCDIMLLHESKKVIKLHENFYKAIETRGFKIEHDVLQNNMKVVINRMLSKTAYRIPAAFFIEACYAEYIVKKYKPKIMITFMDNSILSTFLKIKMKDYGQVINIAHGITADTFRFSMFDFDYVFLFGQSSLDRIARNKVRFGNTKAVLTGSIFINNDYYLPPNKEKKNIIFISSWIPKQIRAVILRNFAILREYAQQHKEYQFFIKLHPLEDRSVWEKISYGISNITILDQETGLKEAIGNVSLIIHQWSNASIEAALLNRPSISLNSGKMHDDYLSGDKFFLPKATDVQSLHERICKIHENYDYYLKKCKEYASYHLERIDSIEYACDCIESIYYGREDFPIYPITEELKGLH